MQERPFQGDVQGDGAAPPIWLMLSIFIVHYSHDSNLVPVHKTPISVASYQIASILYVDDADLVALNNGKESATDIVGRDQLSPNK